MSSLDPKTEQFRSDRAIQYIVSLELYLRFFGFFRLRLQFSPQVGVNQFIIDKIHVCLLYSKYITIKWSTMFVHWRLTPTSGMITKRRSLDKQIQQSVFKVLLIFFSRSHKNHDRFYIYSMILYINCTSGIGAFKPEIFKFGYDGGGPYRCIAINHGGGTRLLP